MNLKEQIEAGFMAALEKLGIRQGEVTPPPPAPATEETQTAADSRLAALEQQNAELLKRAQDAEAEAIAAKGGTEDAEKAARLEKSERAIEALKTSFRITASTGDALAQLAKAHPDAFAPVLEIFQNLEPMPQMAGGTDGGGERAKLENLGGGADAETLHNLTLAKAKDTGLSYGAAMSKVALENPELARSVAAPRTTGVVNDAEG